MGRYVYKIMFRISEQNHVHFDSTRLEVKLTFGPVRAVLFQTGEPHTVLI